MSFSSIPDIPLKSAPTQYSNVVEDLRCRLHNRVDSAPVQYVRLTWLDYANNPRSRILPFTYYDKLLTNALKDDSPNVRAGVRIAKVVFGYVGGRTAEGFGASGNWLLVIDPSSARVWPTEEGVMTVYGWFQEEVLKPELGGRIASPLCPRYILHRAVQYAEAMAGIKALVGVETEFILLSSTDPITAVNSHSWSDNLKLPSGTMEQIVMREIADNLQKAGIELEMYHGEAAPGQYEVVTGPLTPLEAADALLATREIIVNTASKYGWRATLSPRVYEGVPGSAAHTHISIAPTNREAHAHLPTNGVPPNMSPLEASFLSSLLTHLPAIQAFSMPLPASYLRAVDGIWSGGTYVCWGTDNKEAPVRLVDSWNPKSRRFELKCCDGLSNPYLLFASILMAGAHGATTGAVLGVKDLHETSAAELSPDDRRLRGITQRMSLNLPEARERLAQDEVLRRGLGEEFVDAYGRVNKTLAGWADEGPSEAEKRKLYVENW